MIAVTHLARIEAVASRFADQRQLNNQKTISFKGIFILWQMKIT